MISALDFLNRVLPDEGVYCGFVLDGQYKHQRFFQACEELAEFLLAQDALGRTAYYACGVFVEPINRKQENSRGAQAFWGELDAGDNKPYPNALAAAQALAAFVRRAALPTPLLVSSGNGVHFHWPLEKFLDPRTWRRYAEGLLRLFAHHGLHVDPARSRDLASVLRPPGTHNRKHGLIKEVRCVKLEGPYRLEQFAACLDPNLPAVRTDSGRGYQQQLPQAGLPRGLNRAMANIYPERRADANLIASRCRQFARLAETKGVLPEPFWRDIGGIALFCRDGRQYFHENSAGDSRYDPHETDNKLDRWSESAGPTTCKQFAFSGGAEHCVGCPHAGRITSPIVLGYNDRQHGSTNQVSGVLRLNGSSNLLKAKTPDQRVGGFDDSTASYGASKAPARGLNGHRSLPDLPPDYAWGVDGALCFTHSDGKNKNKQIIISQFPVFLAGVHKGEARGAVNYSFAQFKPHDGWETFTLSAGEVHGARAHSMFADKGANLSDKQAFVTYMTKAVDHYHASQKMEEMYEQMGWKHDDTCFLLGTTLYTPEGKRDVQTSDELRIRARDLGPAAGGSLAEWKRASHALFAAGCEAQSFMVLAGFGAPLVRLLDRTESGAVIAGTNTETGGGKSTSAAGAYSIWGRRAGLSVEKSFSAVTKSLTYVSLGNIPCIHDELRARDPEVLRDFIIEYTAGTDKTRTSRSGELKHAKGNWQSLLLTCDNYSLLDLVSGQGDHDEAPAMRVIEIPINVPSHLRKLYRDELKETLERNSGYAADVFLQFLVQPENLNKVRALLKEMYIEIFRWTGWEHKHRFFVRTLACIAVAGIIGRQLGLIECSVDRIVRWAVAILKERVQPGADIWQVGALGHFLNSKLGERLTVDDTWSYGKRNVVLIEPRKGELSVRHEEKANRYLISTASLRMYCVKNGFNFNEMVRFLTDNKVVTGKARQILGAGTQYAGAQIAVIAVDGNHPLLTGRPQAVGSSSLDHRSHGPGVVSLQGQSTRSVPQGD